MTQLEALEQTIIEYQDQLLRFAFFRVGSMDDAKDIVQDVFVKMHTTGAGRRQDVINLKSYLLRSVSNCCNDFHRQNKKRRLVSTDTVATLAAGEEGDVDLMAEYYRLEKLMADIPLEQVEVIKMKTINNLSFVEIANILGVPVTTIKSRFKYGIDKLRSKNN